ncbi:MAG: efflux RND transporter permease subunit, partial [Deltaproteobacteria bacterium]|nr:efflux RND transporter permease subunit [Deltaproteobacteria bacterium]
MLLTNVALRQRTTVFVLVFLIVVVGMVSYLSLPREAAPDIKMPFVIVAVPYPGVGPEDIESLLTNHLETELEDLDDVEEMTSSSMEGVSQVVIKFMPDVDTVWATQQVQDRVNRARAKLPPDTEEPVVKQISSSDWPILRMSLSGPAGPVRFTAIAEDLQAEIEALPDVLEVDIAGGVERELRVEVNPHLLAAVDLSLSQVVQALQAENVNIPGGDVDEGRLQQTIRIAREIRDPEVIRNMVIDTKAGHPVRIREVATVVDGFKEDLTFARYRGEPSVSLSVKKKPGANIIAVVDSVKNIVEARRDALPEGTRITYLNDYSKIISDMVRELENNIITALVLVMLVLFLFIGGRNALFVAVAIPLSMLISFVILAALGVTLNFVVLFSLVLALGMLVDNGIVVVENIVRHRSLGKSLLDAARDGTGEVGWPVISSTLTTLAVFVPLLAWPGIMGEFMGYMPLTLIITLSSSLFVALVVTPVLAGTFMATRERLSTRLRRRLRQGGGPAPEPEPGAPPRRGWFLRGYQRLLGWTLRWSALVLLATVGLLVGSVVLFGGSKPRVEFFPTTTPERAVITLTAPEGTRLPVTDGLSRRVEEYLAGRDNVLHYIGEVGLGGGMFAGASVTNRSKVSLDFQDRGEWTENPFQTIEDLRRFLETVPGAEIEIEKEKRGPPTGKPVNIEITGEDFELLSQVAGEVRERIRDVEGLTDLGDDYSEGRPELGLRIDPVLSSQLILQGMRIVAATVRTAIYGQKATTYRLGDEEFDVVVRLQERFRRHRADVLDLTVVGKEGRRVPLRNVAYLEGDVGPTTIYHKERRRVVTVSGEAEGRSGAEILKEVRARLKDFHPRGATLSYTGENKEMAKAQAFLGQALLVGV